MRFICFSLVGFVLQTRGKGSDFCFWIDEGQRGKAKTGEEDGPQTKLNVHRKGFRARAHDEHPAPQEFTGILCCVKDWRGWDLKPIKIDLNG